MTIWPYDLVRNGLAAIFIGAVLIWQSRRAVVLADNYAADRPAAPAGSEQATATPGTSRPGR